MYCKKIVSYYDLIDMFNLCMYVNYLIDIRMFRFDGTLINYFYTFINLIH